MKKIFVNIAGYLADVPPCHDMYHKKFFFTPSLKVAWIPLEWCVRFIKGWKKRGKQGGGRSVFFLKNLFFYYWSTLMSNLRGAIQKNTLRGHVRYGGGGKTLPLRKEAGITWLDRWFYFFINVPKTLFWQFLQLDLEFSSTQRKIFFLYIPIWRRPIWMVVFT